MMATLTTYLTARNMLAHDFSKLLYHRNSLSGNYDLRNGVANLEILNQLESHIEIFNKSALLSISDLKGNIIHANELFCETSKYSLEEVLYKPHSIIRHPDTPASVFKDMWRTIGKGKVWKGELKNRAKDGTDYWVIATIAPVMGSNGKPIKYISVRYDITKQKQAEEELRIAKKNIDNELFENLAYAKHIHSSFLGTNESLNIGDDSFLIYKACKIISGDFYKIEQKGNKLMIVVGDSTGHGISASYISILALNILSRVTRFCCENPAKILKMINHELNKMTHYNKDKQLTESADMIVCCLDKGLLKLTYASARMRAFIVRNGSIMLLEKEKCSIGTLSGDDFKITNQTVQLQKGDCLYIASDGLSDQLGGVRNKCIGFKSIREIVQTLDGISMQEQKKILEKELITWQGNNEQTDDITVFGIRI
ncbi:MAG: SpoIIE family protein phosphatase [Bacteroidetes bacterium]|nr:SpoIIE family protein phosphatase [Bacteroidota bacterium]